MLLSLLPTPARAATEYSVLDGLSQNSVLALARDESGFLWIGTEDGLNRFDGYEFRVFRPSDSEPAAALANGIRAMASAGRHLLLATHGGGLVVFDRHTTAFRRLSAADGLSLQHLTSVVVAAEGVAYVGSRSGLLRLRWRGDPMRDPFEFDAVDLGDSSLEVWSLTRGPSGVWVATSNGVFRLDLAGQLNTLDVQASAAPFNTDALLEFPAGVLWIGSWDQGLFRLELANGEVQRFLPGRPEAPGLRSSRILSLAAGPEGQVFVGSDRGLSVLDPGCQCLLALDSARSARVAGRGFVLLDIDVDSVGGVFAGFWGEGLVRFSPQDRAFHVERPREPLQGGLHHSRVRATLETRAGELLVGSFGGGVQRASGARVLGQPWDFESMPFDDAAAPEAQLVWALHESRDGRLWAGTDAGLFWRDSAAEVWQPEPARSAGSGMAGVRAFAEDSRGRLWVASSSGLGRMESTHSPRLQIPLADEKGSAALARHDENIGALLIDAEGVLWVGSWGGLHLLDSEGRVIARYRVEDGLPGPIVWDVHRHTDGSLWLATSGGLARVERSAGLHALAFERIGGEPGLPPGAVYALTSDRAGRLWISSNRGLLRYSPQDGAMRLFGRAHGAAADEFAAGAHAIGRNGWLYFGGIDGLTVLDPERLSEALETPIPTLAAITQTVAAGEDSEAKLALGEDGPALRLAHDHAPLILDFTGLVFDHPQRVRYRYRLSPQMDMVELGARRSLILDQLSPGQHTLELEVDNLGKTAARRLLNIEVVPPLTSTLAFRALLLAATALLLIALYVWRTRAMTAQRQALELKVAVRTRELRAQKEALEATALALGDANARLKSLSMLDTLTGLANRRSLIAHLQQCFLAETADLPSVLLVDMDHFKRVNDAYGHQAGDAVLCDFAEVLEHMLPIGAAAGRWGGEEFLVVLPASVAASDWAEWLLARVREREVSIGAGKVRYRISLGLAKARSGESVDEALGRADDALYAAKSAGRDCLRVAVGGPGEH